jgi:uncharacterized protein
MRSSEGMNRRRFTCALSVAPVALGGASSWAAERQALPVAGPEAAPRLTPFPLGRVRLGPGPFQDAEAWNRAFMLRQSPDRLLHTFRLLAGLPSTAKPLGGWEAPDCELRGHFMGHYLSACALGYASRGDAELKARGDYLVKSLAECQAALNQKGYLSAFPQEFFVRLDARQWVWAPFYTYHKLMAGLLDMHLHAGNALALKTATGMAEWVDGWTAARTPAHMQDILSEEFGGMNEALYNLAAATGDARWIGVGDRFRKDAFFTPLAVRLDELRGLHMNTHIPQVIGALRRHELTGEARDREIASFFWDTVSTARTYATGGASNKEHWLTEPYRLAEEWRQGANHQECCCCYNMLKLTRGLFAHDPRAAYMDYYERNLVNHRLGTIEPGTGRTTYFLSLAPGAWKTLATDEATFWCCTGTGVEEFSKLADSIYHHDEHGVYVNLFIASSLDWRERGVRLKQVTDFPRSGATTLTIEAAPGGEWPIHVRIPAWTTSGARIRLNGRPLEAMADPGGYLRLSRAWKAGDVLTLDLPMPLRAERFPDAPQIQALMAGPVALAAQLPRGEISPALMQEQGPTVDKLPLAAPQLKAEGKSLDQLVRPLSDKPHHYAARTADGAELRFAPLNESWNRYSVYLELS